jgi:uncharacterized membrane protein
MSSNPVISSAGRALTPGAVALMLMLCLSWGFNQIAVKLALPDVPPMMQALIRSAGALPVMLLVGWLRGVKFFARDGSFGPGMLAGVLFGIEFVLIFTGLVFTSASRAAVFLYTAPFFVALGSYVFLGERLRALQWGGLGLSFAGVALAIGVPQANVDAKVLLGDLLVVGGGAIWAATKRLTGPLWRQSSRRSIRLCRYPFPIAWAEQSPVACSRHDLPQPVEAAHEPWHGESIRLRGQKRMAGIGLACSYLGRVRQDPLAYRTGMTDRRTGNSHPSGRASRQ